MRLATICQTLEATYSGRDADAAGIDWRAQYDGAWADLRGRILARHGRWLWSLRPGDSRPAHRQRCASLFSETNNGGATIYADLRDRFALTVPVISLGVGFMYEYRGVFVVAGYEVTNFIGLFERPTFVDDFAQGKIVRPSNNLALDGFFLQLGLSF